ncbi:lysophospholipid acyltransferase family protein [Candidatus Leptofilum sp.]|uniref:lysophospholipid acyltransferase family protein n=1 Tax=Candidatus Leptofilum sp. TaxID=3241576 RepID=UPI003B5B1C73
MQVSKHSSKVDPLNAPQLGKAIPRWGNRFMRWLGRTILRLVDWRFEGQVPNLPKMVLIGAPHTSNWDFPLAMVALFALQARVYWLGKHTFVNSPLKPLLLWMGGMGVDRRAAHGVVTQTAVQFQKHEQFLLGLSPEGTRKLVSHWKMGFFYIAKEANVPIIPVSLDYGRKTIGIGDPIWPEVGETAVLDQLKTFYDGVQAKYPDQFSLETIRPRLNDRPQTNNRSGADGLK